MLLAKSIVDSSLVHCYISQQPALSVVLPLLLGQITSGTMGKTALAQHESPGLIRPERIFFFLVVWAFSEEGRLQGPTSQLPYW